MLKYFETTRKALPIKGSRTNQQGNDIPKIPKNHASPTRAQLQDNASIQGLTCWSTNLAFAAPPPEGTAGAQGAETAAPAGHATAPTDHAAAPGAPPAQGVAPARDPSASLRAAAAAAGRREGAKYHAHTNPSHTHTTSPKPYPPKAAFPEGRPRPIRPPTPVRTPPGVTLPQLQRQQDARWGEGPQVEQGAGHGSAEQGTGGDRGSAQGQA